MAAMTRVRTIFSGVAGTPWYSNLFFAGDGDDQAYTDLVSDFWGDWANYMANTVTWTVQDTVTHIDTASGQPTGVGSVDGATGTGLNASQPLPYANQMLVRLTTGEYRNGRQIVGKMFLPAPVQAYVSGGQFTADMAAAVTGYADEIRQAPVIADDFWLVYSPTARAAYPVTGNAAQRKPAVLRSRRD